MNSIINTLWEGVISAQYREVNPMPQPFTGYILLPLHKPALLYKLVCVYICWRERQELVTSLLYVKLHASRSAQGSSPSIPFSISNRYLHEAQRRKRVFLLSCAPT